VRNQALSYYIFRELEQGVLVDITTAIVAEGIIPAVTATVGALYITVT
jgi:hypothetical protein